MHRNLPVSGAVLAPPARGKQVRPRSRSHAWPVSLSPGPQCLCRVANCRAVAMKRLGLLPGSLGQGGALAVVIATSKPCRCRDESSWGVLTRMPAYTGGRVSLPLLCRAHCPTGVWLAALPPPRLCLKRSAPRVGAVWPGAQRFRLSNVADLAESPNSGDAVALADRALHLPSPAGKAQSLVVPAPARIHLLSGGTTASVAGGVSAVDAFFCSFSAFFFFFSSSLCRFSY